MTQQPIIQVIQQQQQQQQQSGGCGSAFMWIILILVVLPLAAMGGCVVLVGGCTAVSTVAVSGLAAQMEINQAKVDDWIDWEVNRRVEAMIDGTEEVALQSLLDEEEVDSRLQLEIKLLGEISSGTFDENRRMEGVSSE